MSRNSLLAVLSIAVVVAVSLFFWYNVAPSTKSVLQPPVLAPLTTPTTLDSTNDFIQEFAEAETLFNGDWTVTAESFLGYRVTQTSGNTEVTGRTTKLAGSATIGNNEVQEAQFSAQVDSMTTDDDGLDAIFLQEMVQAENFPDVALTITSMELPDDKKRAEGLLAAGTLTLRDITREAAFTVDTQIGDDGNIELVAIIEILLSDYEISQPVDPLVSYEDKAQIETRLFLERI